MGQSATIDMDAAVEAVASGAHQPGHAGSRAQVPAEEPVVPPPPEPEPPPDAPVVPPDDPNRPDVTREPSIDPPTTHPPMVAPSESPILDPPPPARI